MKKIFLPFIAIAIMTFFVACSNEELLPEATEETNPETTIEETRTLSITATMPGDEDPKTRVTLERDDGLGIILKWQAGDRLQFAFVQNQTKIKSIIPLTGSNISNDGKTVTFNIPLPTDADFDQNTDFDLYGLYGLESDIPEEGGLSEENPTNVILTKNPGSINNTLTAVQNRGDVMLYFESKNINPQNPNATVEFEHLGSLFAISLRNTSSTPLTGFQELRLQGVGGGTDENWAYNSGAGGQIFNLLDKKLQNKDSGGNHISYLLESGATLPSEQATTLWAWYPPLPDKKWPALQLQLISSTDDTDLQSLNSKPARNEPTPAGRVFHFYATWDGTDLIFTNDDFTTPSPALP